MYAVVHTYGNQGLSQVMPTGHRRGQTGSSPHWAYGQQQQSVEGENQEEGEEISRGEGGGQEAEACGKKTPENTTGCSS